ncbi:M18 family aminopeptidase [Arcanobacterium pinnipediorum]|uniref:M18 family aminopeptidase n=1 Tax=Arcanobacterium pinnipediorum TaxID=1503041 RepID=A0ABY5AIY5_9ACTO|nr:M18 family aminopeptidase [Arcanobacterium pinnipediorum]USR79148.1 M18 family aminopeptidase [Arcanobacterium pinnipediorum]
MTYLDSFTPRTYAQAFGEFISHSPTSYHAAENIAQILHEAGFTRCTSTEPWSNADRAVMVTAGAVVAWQMPRTFTQHTGARIIGSHTDSPSFKLKPVATSITEGYSQVNVEVYGGPLLNSWLNRDLGIAGQIITTDGERHLVKTEALMTIPQLAPHLDRSQNDELKLSRQQDYHPLWSCNEAEVMDHICASAGIDPQQVAGTDLFAYDSAPYRIYGGPSGEDFFSAARQDNLTSVFASLQAFLSVAQEEVGHNDVLVFVAFDHEEVGSATPTGASGPILESTLRRIVDASAYAGEEGYWRFIANSSCISADAGHALNPNKIAKHDPAHHPILGGGPLLKLNAQQRYATDALGSAIWLRAAHQAGVATQEFVSNNDVPCGTTIGPLTATRFGMTTVDVGVAMLSMHSVREITNPADLLGLAKIAAAYWMGA